MYLLAFHNGGTNGRLLKLSRPPFDFSAGVLSPPETSGGWNRFIWLSTVFVALKTGNGSTVYVYDGSFNQTQKLTFGNTTATVYGLAVTRDASMLAAGWTQSPYFQVRSLPSGAVISGTPSLGSYPKALAFSPDGQYMAVCMNSTAPYLRIFRTDDWSEVAGVPTLPARSSWCDWSPDGSLFAVLCRSGETGLMVYSTEDWSLIYSHTRRSSDSAANFAFSPADGRIAVADNSYIDVHDLVSGTLLTTMSPVFSGAVYGVSWAPDGALLAAIGNGSPHLRVYETGGWTQVPVSGLPTASGFACAFSPELPELVDLPRHDVGGVEQQIINYSGVDALAVKTRVLVGSEAVPQRARVSLMRMRDQRVLQRAWSGEDGVAVFRGVRSDQRYLALAEYPGNPDNPAAENYMRPVTGVSLKRGESSS